MGMNAKRKLKSIRFHIGACALGFLMIYPLLWLLASSFKSNETMFLDTYSLIPKVWAGGKNYASGFAGVGGVKFSTFFFNSLVVTVVGTLGCVVTSLFAAYALSRIKFRFSAFWFGCVMMTMMIPANTRTAEATALEIGKKMGLQNPEVISKEVMQEAEGTRIEMKGKIDFDIDPETLVVPPEPHHLDDATLYKEFEEHPMVVVCGTVGEDEHSVGLREIINIKHGGIEKWGVKVNYLGTSVPVEKLVDAAVELNANAILASTIISHDNIHYKNMKRINELAIEKGIRDKVIIAAGGTQVIPEDAVKTGIDAGFGRDSHGIDVATFLAEEAMRRRGELPKEDKEEK